MTGIAALILLLTGFQVALLLAGNIFNPRKSALPHKDGLAGDADTLEFSPEYFAPIPINLNRADSLALLVHLDFDKVFLSFFPPSQLSYPPSAVIRPLPIPRNALLTSPKPLRCPPAVSRLIP